MCNIIKRLGIITLICFTFGGIDCNAQTQFSPTLAKIEKSIFGMAYDSQSDDIRLKRIEEAVYGTTSNGPTSQRIEKLSKDICAEQIGQEIKPKKDSFADDEESIKPITPKADSSVNYPIVNSLEQKIFGKDNKTIDINQRLANLEQKIFKQTYNDNDLNSRVERLKVAIMPERVAREANYKDNDEEEDIPKYYENQDVLSENAPQNSDNLWDNFKNNFRNNQTGSAASIPTYNQNNSVLDDYDNTPSLVVNLSAVEKSILRKSFPNDTVSNRLARLEGKVFNQTFADDEDEARLERVASAYQSKKTAKKYDNNKFSQRMATAMQVGAFLLVILAAIL